jgi:pyruvate kinase
MEVNDAVYIDNGKIRTKVVEKNSRMVHLLFMNGGVLDDGKGVNVPNKKLATPTFRKEDLEIIRFATERGVEYFALSFMSNSLKIKQPIIAVTPTQKTKRQLELVFSVLPVQMDYQNDPDRIFAVANKMRSNEFDRR